MNHNTLLAIVCFLRILGGMALVGAGIYLLMNKHPTAGGWCIGLGIIFAWVSISSDDDDKDEK